MSNELACTSFQNMEAKDYRAPAYINSFISLIEAK
jgi:hypothetical protein